MLPNIWRRNWVANAVAVVLLMAVLAFVSYAEARQHLADQRQHQADVRAEKQRKAICAILANIPGDVPAEIANARQVFARPGHPTDCQPVVRPKPMVTVTPTPRPASAPSPPSMTPVGVTPTPTVRTVTPAPSRPPTPHPTPSRTPAPSPKPTPKPTCHRVVITVCT